MERRIIVLMLFSFFCFFSAFAQYTVQDSLRVQNELKKLKAELNLSQNQLDTLTSLLLDHHLKNDMMNKNIRMIQSVKVQNDESLEFQMSGIMRPVQYEKYLKNKSMKEDSIREKKVKEKMAYYRQELKLNDQQYNDMQLLLNKFALQKSQLKLKIKNNDELLKQEVKKLKKEMKENLKSILSKEQFQKFNQL